jgi:hypothetical protein
VEEGENLIPVVRYGVDCNGYVYGKDIGCTLAKMTLKEFCTDMFCDYYETESVCLIEGYDCTDVDAFGTTSTQCERYRDAETEAECIEEKITESTSYERCPCREGAEHGHCPCNVEMVVIIRVAEHNLICGDKVYDVSAEGGIRPFNEGVK